jgi:hypothetical protein
MIRTISLLTGLWLLSVGAPALRGEAAGPNPDFREVYDLIREHLAGVSEAELNHTAVQALVSALAPKVTLTTNVVASEATAGQPLVTRSNLFGGSIGYVRIERVDDGLAKAVRDACQALDGTNKLKGLVLDLRYAGGTQYAAAVAVADLFLKKERPLLNWGEGLVRSKEKTDALALPVAVLVNRQTAGAAEALAAVLRETGAGLIFGGATAGQAMIAQEYPLKNGMRLRIATAPVQLADGSSLSAQGIKPDITVTVGAQEERAYYADAFRLPPQSSVLAGGGFSLTNQPGGTNRASRRFRFNEAELVRERRDSVGPDLEQSVGKEQEAEEPAVHDPALARALDVLKGLAVIRQSRS